MARKKLIKRITVPEIRERKGAQPIVCLTSYTAPVAEMVDPHVDLILVGDSVAMVLYGMESTLGISLETMIEHGRAVVRASQKALVAVDMPFGSYQESKEQAFRNASQIMCETGCQAVKLEGGIELAETVRFLSERGVPVFGHVGLRPQNMHTAGGFRSHGKEHDEALQIVNDAKAIADAGAFAIVVEGTVEPVAARVTEETPIPVIGIGASPRCDGQVLVTEDLAGMFNTFRPKFVKRYAEIGDQLSKAVQSFAEDVRHRRFPESEHCFRAEPRKISG
ncbi:MAG: 3-methyl-2-oxobutanoate hydroxymethyltransferase [Rhodospirillaceae bacterium]|nr:3-methyl-2-oxobutanoate hydroxymethyltransferase [Rhodospirillaceae bacterium]|tara:strand:- start:203 stop:1039 length:837 start_codon:yes stop_codon:yes gene_type:complete